MRGCALGILGLMLVTPGAAAQSRASLIHDADLDRLGFRRQWEAHLPMARGAAIDRAFLVDEVLYVTTNDGTLYSVEAAAGLIRWVDRVTEPSYTIYRPTHVPTADGTGHVVVLTTSGAFVLDRFTGARLQRFDPGFAPGGPPLVIGSNYLAGSNDGRFYSVSIGGPAGRAFKLWEVFVGSAVTAAPLLHEGDRLIFASQGGIVYSCFASDKTLLWSYRTGGGVVADPAMDESGIFVASLDRTLYKLSLGGGQPLWRVRFGDPLRDGPVAAAHTVFLYSMSRGVVALDADTGRERWNCEEARQFAAHHRSTDVLYAADRRLLVVDHETGRSIGAIGMPEALGVVVNAVTDAVFVFGTHGRILCVRLDDVPYLRFQQVEAARSELNQPPASGDRRPADFPPLPVPEQDSTSNPLRSWREREPQP